MDSNSGFEGSGVLVLSLVSSSQYSLGNSGFMVLSVSSLRLTAGIATLNA